MAATKADIIAGLQSDILRLEGFKPYTAVPSDAGLDFINNAFPNQTFPTGAIHEFLTPGPEHSAASTGFIAGILSQLMKESGTALWIGTTRQLFPPALATFGIRADRIIFIDLTKERHVMWALDEALKCGALTAVVGEVQQLNFTESRRLQLAVEESKVTGFVMRRNCQQMETTACVARWKISSLPSEKIQSLPGVGYPQWRVELLRVRNGKPNVWSIRWASGKFELVPKQKFDVELQRKAG